MCVGVANAAGDSGIGIQPQDLTSCVQGSPTPQGMMIVPQKLYMVLGSLRQQLLYPAFTRAIVKEALVGYDDHETGPLSIVDDSLAGVAGFQHAEDAAAAVVKNGASSADSTGSEEVEVEVPSDDELCAVLRQVRLPATLLC